MSRRHEKGCQARRQRVVDEKPQAEYGRGISRSIAEAAAKRKHSRISSVCRSGYSARISRSASPPASKRSTVGDGNSQVTHTRDPAHLCGIDSDAREILHWRPLDHCRNSRHLRQTQPPGGYFTSLQLRRACFILDCDAGHKSRSAPIPRCHDFQHLHGP